MKKIILSIAALAAISTQIQASEFWNGLIDQGLKNQNAAISAGYKFYDNSESKSGVPTFEIESGYAHKDIEDIFFTVKASVDANSNYSLDTKAVLLTEPSKKTSVFLMPFFGLSHTKSEATVNSSTQEAFNGSHNQTQTTTTSSSVQHYTDTYAKIGTYAVVEDYEAFIIETSVGAGKDSLRTDLSVTYNCIPFYITAGIGKTSFYNASKDYKDQTDYKVSLTIPF